MRIFFGVESFAGEVMNFSFGVMERRPACNEFDAFFIGATVPVSVEGWRETDVLPNVTVSDAETPTAAFLVGTLVVERDVVSGFILLSLAVASVCAAERVTAFRDPGTSFMQEEDVPELEWYDLTKENFYDAIISNHMGVRKIIHFIRQAMVDYNLTGWQIVRGALKGHNTGWANYTGDNDGYYANYPDEGAALAQWYYEEGHLYDNVFTWTKGEVAAKQRAGKPWEDWWYDKEPSLDPVSEQPKVTTAPVVTTGGTTTTTVSETTPVIVQNTLMGDIDLNGAADIADAVLLTKYLCGSATLNAEQGKAADMDGNRMVDAKDLSWLKRYLLSR